MATSRYRVAGMDCAAEEQLVRMALADLDGIDAIDVRLDAREVLVAHSTDRRQLDQAMHGLGLGAVHLADGTEDLTGADPSTAERPALLFALVVNAVFFVGEITFGFLSRSMGVVADGLDMGADTAVYALSLLAVGGAAARKKRYARASGYAQLTLAFLGLAEVVRRFVVTTEPPEPATMVVVTLLALAGNVAVLVVLHRVRSGEAHIEASWIFTANDVVVNLLVLAAAAAVTVLESAIPDLVAGAIIFGVVLSGAWRILRLSRPGQPAPGPSSAPPS